jgi:biopolymer transport protein ExbD
MSDIAFLLLIFIMLISLINYRREIKIAYPEARHQEVTQADRNLEIWIDRAGAIYYKGEIVPLPAVEGIIADAVAADPSVRVHILADRDTPYRNVDGVVEVLKILQHRVVSFVVKEGGR